MTTRRAGPDPARGPLSAQAMPAKLAQQPWLTPRLLVPIEPPSTIEAPLGASRVYVPPVVCELAEKLNWPRTSDDTLTSPSTTEFASDDVTSTSIPVRLLPDVVQVIVTVNGPWLNSVTVVP